MNLMNAFYAILEPNGSLSVMKKQPQQQVTKSDIKIPGSTLKHIPSEIIVDGKIIYKNLKELNLNENWLNNQLFILLRLMSLHFLNNIRSKFQHIYFYFCGHLIFSPAK